MDLTAISLEQLETLQTALAEYVAARRQYEAAGKIEALERERRQVMLELDEARAGLAAQKELAGRLMSALKLTTANGHGEPTPAVAGSQPVRKSTGKKPRRAQASVTSDAPTEVAAEPVAEAEAEEEIGLPLDELIELDMGEEW